MGFSENLRSLGETVRIYARVTSDLRAAFQRLAAGGPLPFAHARGFLMDAVKQRQYDAIAILILHPHSTGFGQARAKALVTEESRNCIRKPLFITGVDQQAIDAVGDQFRYPTDTRCDDSNTGGHRLKHAHGQPFVVRGRI